MKIFLRYRLDFAIAAVLCGLAIGAFAQSDRKNTQGSSGHGSTEQDRTGQGSGGQGRTGQGLAGQVLPGQEHASGTTAAAHPPGTLESARQRWERLTPEEKVRAHERYEKFLALSDAERNDLALRAQRLKESSARVQRDLSPEVRERLSTLAPEKRHELIGELVEGEAKEKGERIRGMLPENVLKRLEAARPQDRARFLEEFKLKQRKRVARYAIDQLGRRLSLPAEEVGRLKTLPDDERARAVLDLKKQLNEREALEFGLPPGISQREWDAWEKLPPEEFFEVMQRYQHMRAAHQAAAEDAHTDEARADGIRGSTEGTASGRGSDPAGEATAKARGEATVNASNEATAKPSGEATANANNEANAKVSNEATAKVSGDAGGTPKPPAAGEKYPVDSERTRASSAEKRAAAEADSSAKDVRVGTGAPARGEKKSGNKKSDPGRETARPSPAKLEALHKLSEARRLRPSDFLDLASLPKAERAVRVEHRRRERCLAAISEGELLSPDRISELTMAPDPMFFETVRRLLGDPRRAIVDSTSPAVHDPAASPSTNSDDKSGDRPHR